jgi:predicted negative regulator of RcsB-dependent stress response
MAMKHLDLEEQEQLDKLKSFWNQYGNLISSVLIVVFGSFAAYNIYNWYERREAVRASALYDEVERAVQSGDATKIDRAAADMKAQYGGTTFALQAALLAAKSLYEKGQIDPAKAQLAWVIDKGDASYQAIAKLRLAGMQMDAKQYDEALKSITGLPKEFEPLAADRRGDILLAQGKREEAKAAYLAAHKGMEERVEYRRLVEVKLNALGVDVSANKDDMKAAAATAAATPAAAPPAPAASQ